MAYVFRTVLGPCAAGPISSQQFDLISCNRIGIMKASTQDKAEHHLEIEKKLGEFGVKEMLKKCIMK